MDLSTYLHWKTQRIYSGPVLQPLLVNRSLKTASDGKAKIQASIYLLHQPLKANLPKVSWGSIILFWKELGSICTLWPYPDMQGRTLAAAQIAIACTPAHALHWGTNCPCPVPPISSVRESWRLCVLVHLFCMRCTTFCPGFWGCFWLPGKSGSKF